MTNCHVPLPTCRKFASGMIFDGLCKNALMKADYLLSFFTKSYGGKISLTSGPTGFDNMSWLFSKRVERWKFARINQFPSL